MPSWVSGANAPETHFPLNNLPYGAFSVGGDGPRCCVAIGDQVLDLAALEAAGLIEAGPEPVFCEPGINAFMALGEPVWTRVRARLTDLLSETGDAALRDDAGLRQKALHDRDAVTLHMPFKVAEYTDFYAGRQHATNVGTMFRGAENALPPNWLHIPIGYNGRASSVIVSGTPVRRPLGQTKAPDADAPGFGPCRRLDIELEMGAVIGTSNPLGQPVGVDEADAMIFGYVLLNDWSARDIQAWEYQPLGPFQAKAFATSIGAWVVPKAALEPFRVPPPPREKPLLPYIADTGPMFYDVELEVHMQPEGAAEPTIIAQTNFRELYYSAAQQLAHHSSSGCAMNTGDLLGSGTISGPEKTSYGSLLELTWGGKEPLMLKGGVTRSFIEDGDTLTLVGCAEGDGYRIGFGTCSGKILPALKFPG